LSWTIDFVDYSEARNGTAQHTISEFELNLNPNSITSVDYFKNESRLCNIKFYQDDWTNSHLGSFMGGTGNILYTYSFFWKYVLRIKYNGAIQYIGYLRRDGISLDNNEDTYSFRLCDIIGVLYNVAKDKKHETLTVPQQVHGSKGLLSYNLNGLMGDSSGASLVFDSYLIDNYDLVSGLEVDNIELYNKNNDEQLSYIIGNTTDWDWFVEDVVTVSGLTDTVVVAQHGIIHINDDIVEIIMMKYTQEIYYELATWKVKERIYIKTFDVNNDVLLTNQNLQFEGVTGTYNSLEDAVTRANELWLYHQYYSPNHPVIDNFELTFGNDTYSLTTNANELNYTGTMNFYTVIMDTTKERSYESDIRMLLLMNNVTLSIHNDGIIEIINKTKSVGETVTINSSDVLSLSQSGITKQTPDYSSANSGMIQENQDVVSNAEEDHYEDLFQSLVKEITVKIENNYNLSLNQVISMYGYEYKINSIHLDNDRFIYTIKAWGV
jgi:hypothetical protein